MGSIFDPKVFFLNPRIVKQRQYEALRSHFIDDLTRKEAAERWGYTINTYQSLIRDFQNQNIEFFQQIKKGPKHRQTSDPVREEIVFLRKQNKSVQEIENELISQGHAKSISTINRILQEEGFPKLPRRTNKERGLTKKGTQIPPKSRRVQLDDIQNQTLPCQVAGIYLFIPFMIDIGLYDLISASSFPETSQLSKLNSCLSVLALKIIGQERLSQINNYGFDRGFGLFAGLNVLPGPTTISTYSHNIDIQSVMNFQTAFVKSLRSYDEQLYSGSFINLDFHTIPHFGDNHSMEYQHIPTRNRSMRGALTFFAQDAETEMISYTNADIHRSEASDEILNFIDYWIDVKGVLNETLVFDSRLTNYTNLRKMDTDGVKFITLRRKGKNLIEDAWKIPYNEWETVTVDIPKRKFPTFKCHDKEIYLQGYGDDIRQVIIRDHGRENPTFIITNNRDLELQLLVETYARRWRIENSLAELIKFFSMNALSSPIMIRIHFDVLMTVVASSLYNIFSNSVPRFKTYRAPRFFREFINSTGKECISNDDVLVKLRKKATSPILKSQDRYRRKWEIPLWENRSLRFEWIT